MMMEAVTALDARLLDSLYALRDPNLVQFFIWASELGRTWTVYGLGSIAVLLLLLRKHVAYAVGLGVSLAASGFGVLLIKGLVERPRPPEELQAYMEIWYSFPSAHATLSAALYGFLALLAWHTVKRKSWRLLTAGFFIVLVIFVSFSRIYLGVHYPSDVLAGVLLGGVCVWLGWKYAKIAHNGRT